MMRIEEAQERLTIVEYWLTFGDPVQAEMACLALLRDAMRSFARTPSLATPAAVCAAIRQINRVAYLVMQAERAVYDAHMRTTSGNITGPVVRTTLRIIGSGGVPVEVTFVAVREIAAHYGVTPAAVSNRIARDPAFPAPLIRVRATPVWSLADIEAYWAKTPESE
jgi:hypothetical protein